MQKKLIALAIAGLGMTGGAAYAQSNVTFYGTLRPSFDIINTTNNGINGHQTTMNSNTSVIGFKGSEDLGNGLKTIFKLEYNIDPVNENTSIGGNGTGSGTGTQDMYLGFASNSWGSIKFGAINNAEKAVFAKYDPFSFSIGDYNNIFTQGVNSRNSQAFYYTSPTWSGFHFETSYALDNPGDSSGVGTTNGNIGVDGQGNTNTSKFSLGGDYKWGGLDLTAAFSQGNNESAGVSGNANKSQRYGAAYTFASKTKLFGVFGKDKDFKGRGNQNTWMIGVVQPIAGALSFKADYIKAQDDKDTAGDQSAKNLNLGLEYALSKRTNVQALYTYLKNGADAGFGFDSADAADGSGNNMIADGGKANALSIRMQHSF